MRPPRRLTAVLLVAVALAACGEGDTIQNAGDRPEPTSAPTMGSTVAPTAPGTAVTTVPGSTPDSTPSSPPGSGPGASDPVTTATPTTAAPTTPPATVAPSTTQPTLLETLPPCPVDALDAVEGTVEITFWHGMAANLEQELAVLTDRYNASQSKVRVELQNQGGYEQVIDKYLQSGSSSRPELAQAPEYAVQEFRDTQGFIPVEACFEAAGFDRDALLPAARNAYSTEGVQWSMPFNLSNPVLFYNRATLAAAGLDPDDPPRSLEELEQASRQIVETGAASYGLVVDTNFDSGGGWYVEQWFAKAGEFYADNENGRSAPATRVLFDGPTGVNLLTYLQNLVASAGGFNVGDNASGQDAFLKIADQNAPGAMTIGTSAALGTVLAAVDAGIAPGIAREDIGVSPMPGPNGSGVVVVGGASIWISADKGDAETAAAWDYVEFLASAEVQSEWASVTGYVPIRQDAAEVEPLATTYAQDPRFKVAYDSLIETPDEPTAVGPLLGPQRAIRVLTSRALATVLGGGDPAAALSEAAAQANSLLAQYNSTR
jgi:sn-glycerol 3-phosphate transport system substrate-binding protein